MVILKNIINFFYNLKNNKNQEKKRKALETAF